MELATLKVLANREIRQIHETSLNILEQCGVRILNSKMLDFLKNKGLNVDMEKQEVRFSRSCVEDAVSKVPPRFDVFDRNGRYVYTLGDRIPRIAAGHNAVFWMDTETGQTRSSCVADVELFSRICQELECMDMIGIPVMPQEVPNPKATLLYGVKAVIENSTKPIYFSTDNAKVNNACIEMLKEVFKGDLQQHVYGISQFSPTSPLFWEKNVLEAFMDMIDTGVPISILSEPIAGLSAPYTLAGLLTMNNAECLSGIVIIELLKPGTKIMYGSSWTTFNMRTGAALVGSAETTICRIAAAQLAQFYSVPSHTTAPNSDNHAHDEQNAWEKAFSQFCAIAAGHDLIVNCGMFATGMTCSHEQLMMDEEMSAMAKRIKAGIKVSQETIAEELIKRIGPQGKTYLTSEHTKKWLYSDEYLKPRLSVSGPLAGWQAKGSKDTYQIARDKVREYAQLEVREPLEANVRAKLNEIITSF
jgi:trimethylamine--corrinoid protein Co-methyltransferase